jgi:hypothetical protein
LGREDDQARALRPLAGLIVKTVEVMRVVSWHPPTQGAFVEINAADFDPARHTLYTADAAPPFPPMKRGPGRPRKQNPTEAINGDR